MLNSNSKDGLEVPTSTNADVTTSSQTIAKPIVSGSLHYVCNADCPDVEYGNCCHPSHCQKELVSNDR